MFSPSQSPALRQSLYYSLLRIRMVEEAIAARYSNQEMRCPVHLSTGQEGAAVGSCAPLLVDDAIFSTHRCHGHYLAKGGCLNAMVAELHGKATGCCGGRGGSMHLFDDSAGVVASVPIVGSNIPLAVGAALAFSQEQSDRIAVAFMGDAAAEEGVFHESLNLAATHALPVVFVLENNLYSVYTRIDDRQPSAVTSRFALAHDMPHATADGSNVLDVYGRMEAAASRARRGQGPTLLSIDTYRFVEHCGPSDDDELGYRPAPEVHSRKDACPLALYERRLRDAGELDDARVEGARVLIAGEIRRAFELANKAPYPCPSTLLDGVLSAPPVLEPVLEVLA